MYVAVSKERIKHTDLANFNPYLYLFYCFELMVKMPF